MGWLLVEQDERPTARPSRRLHVRWKRCSACWRSSRDPSAAVGVVGCGMIAEHYVSGAPAFDTRQPVACADLEVACTSAFASVHRLRGESVVELLADPQVELVLNLTPPNTHAGLTLSALSAGKRVYSEKPLATSLAQGREHLADAKRLGLRLGCAPDTFLGGAYQAARRLMRGLGIQDRTVQVARSRCTSSRPPTRSFARRQKDA